MRLSKYSRYSLLLIFLSLSITLSAQSIELLGIYTAGDNYYLNAKVDLAGKKIVNVVTYTFRMTDGYTITTSSYDLMDDMYISALLTDMPEDCSFRMEVTLNDDTKLLTECVNTANKEAFMWVGDYNWTEAVSGWDETVGGPHPPKVDGNVDPSMDMIVNRMIYYKGISNKADGYVLYNLPPEKNFVRFKSRLGVQDGTGGSLRFNIICNDSKTPLIFTRASGQLLDLDTDAFPSYIPSLPITKLRLRLDPNGANDGDFGHFLLARLYMGNKPSKESQSITFQTKTGTIITPQSITLKATATSGGKIYYRIVKGSEIASLNGDVIHFADNKKGEVLVEAIQFGNEQFAATNQVLIFNVNTGALIKMSSFYAIPQSEQKMAYLYIDTKSRILTQLKMTLYDDAMKLKQIDEIDLLPFIQDVGFTRPQVINFPVTLKEGNVYRLTYSSEDQTPLQSSYCEGNSEYDYMSDLSCTYKTGWGKVGVDKSVEGTDLNIAGQIYKKGFGIYSVGWMEYSFSLDKYERFVSDVGKQSGKPYQIEFALKMNGGEITRTGAINNTKQIHWDFPIKNINNIHIDVLAGNDGTNSDYGAIGAPRLYLASSLRKKQTLSWHAEQVETRSKPFKLTLDATVSSGLAPVYRIVKGSEFAKLENGNVLNIHNLPGKDSIVVEAFQPGTNEWEPTEVQKCIFRLTKGRIVQKDERIELENGENLDELIVYADANSCGQVSVKSGIAEIKKLILKYTFVPKAWNFISFPSDLNIDKISNLNELGYYQNGKTAGNGAYYIRSYDTHSRAEEPNGNNWRQLTDPLVKGLKGYIMGINNALGMESKEIVFTIDNVSLDFESSLRILNLTLDMTHIEPHSEQTVYVSPTNVKGNTLKVAVAFDPEDTSILPINFERALENARITFTPNHSGIRLTLPDPTPAKVAIYDRKMKKLIKAVRYVSPMMIDISDLKPGTYQVVISYGNAMDVKSFTK